MHRSDQVFRPTRGLWRVFNHSLDLSLPPPSLKPRNPKPKSSVSSISDSYCSNQTEKNHLCSLLSLQSSKLNREKSNPSKSSMKPSIARPSNEKFVAPWPNRTQIYHIHTIPYSQTDTHTINPSITEKTPNFRKPTSCLFEQKLRWLEMGVQVLHASI